jgi:hypothetical protein
MLLALQAFNVPAMGDSVQTFRNVSAPLPSAQPTPAAWRLLAATQRRPTFDIYAENPCDESSVKVYVSLYYMDRNDVWRQACELSASRGQGSRLATSVGHEFLWAARIAKEVKVFKRSITLDIRKSDFGPWRADPLYRATKEHIATLIITFTSFRSGLRRDGFDSRSDSCW